jgi:hypothetical protein
MDPMYPLMTIMVSALVGSVSGVFANMLTLKHKLQAQNEYAILMKIWGKAYWLKSRANSLRPTMDTGNPNAPEEKQKRLAAFDKAKGEFDEEMYLNKPFYPDDIYRALKQLGNNAVHEAIEYHFKTASPNDHKYWTDSEASAKKINDFVDQLCDAIRGRIHVTYRFRQGIAYIVKWLVWPLSIIKRPFRRIERAAQ